MVFNNILILFYSLILSLSLVQFAHPLWLPGDALDAQSKETAVADGLESIVLAPSVNVKVKLYYDLS